MRWLRLIFYCVPLLLIASVRYFLVSLGYHDEAAEETLTFAITTEPVGIDPLTEQDPISEEIESLLFDTLLGRTPEMKLEGRLAESWSYTSRARFFCISERYAKTAWSKVQATRDQWVDWGIVHAELLGDEIRIDLGHHHSTTPEKILEAIPDDLEAPVTVWRIHADHSAAESFANFRDQAREGWQSRRTWSGDADYLEVHSAGLEANFERELRLYYDHNPQLHPEIEKMGQLSHIFEPSMTMNLRSGVRWHDGRLLSVEDVLHSIDLARESRNHPALSSAIRSMYSLEANGPLSFTVTYREPFAPALELWEQIRILPAHAWHAYSPRRPDLPLVGTGPFTIRRWEPSSPIVLDRYPGYFRGSPDNRRIVYKPVLENRLRRILFQIHTIDSYEAKPSTYNSLEERGEFSLVRSPPVQQVYVAWNHALPAFADPRVRLALAHAVDIDRLLQELLNGNGRPVDRLFHPDVDFCRETIQDRITHDFETARELLASTRWENDLRFTLTVVAGDEFQRSLARFLQREWRRLGVQVQLRMVSYGKMSGIRSSNTGYEAALLIDPLPHQLDQFSRWHSSEIGQGRGNFTRVEEPELDATLEAIRATFDPAGAAVLATRLQEQLYRLQPCFPICLRDTARVFHKHRVEVVEKSIRGEPARREVGSNRVSLTHDLAWWVKQPLPSEAVPPGLRPPTPPASEARATSGAPRPTVAAADPLTRIDP